MFIWHTLRVGEGRLEIVDAWPTLPEVIWEMACSSWEELDNAVISLVVDDSCGEVVATAIFGPENVLLVTLSDGRRFCLPEPEFYREAKASDQPATSEMRP